MDGVLSGRAKQFFMHLRKRKLKNWQLIAVFFVFLGLSFYFLRQNNLKMIELRNEVITADEQGGDIAGALKRLNSHVFKHMNTKIAQPIELVKTYDRQAQAIIKSAAKSPKRDLYAEAARKCVNRGALFSETRNQCVIKYIEANNQGFGGPVKINLPNKNRFTYSFVSPLWTPDLAGTSLLITGVAGLWLVARLGEFVAVKLLIKHRQKRLF